MEAKVKATGEIGIVASINILFGNKGYRYQSDEVEFINSDADIDTTKDVDYWTCLEHQYAGMAMQGILSNPESELDYKGDETLPQALAGCSAKVAHALVEKLKENKV
jgi:hypothetical protein